MILGSLARDLLTGDYGKANDPPLNRKTENEDGTDPTPPSQVRPLTGSHSPSHTHSVLLTHGFYERHLLKPL